MKAKAGETVAYEGKEVKIIGILRKYNMYCTVLEKVSEEGTRGRFNVWSKKPLEVENA